MKKKSEQSGGNQNVPELEVLGALQRQLLLGLA